MTRTLALSFSASAVVTALTLLVFSNSSADEKKEDLASENEQQTAFAAQDVRERESALAFARSRGLDLSKAVESETGLWSVIIKEGQGPFAMPENTVTAHCTGWLADGTKFWSSHDGKARFQKVA